MERGGGIPGQYFDQFKRSHEGVPPGEALTPNKMYFELADLYTDIDWKMDDEDEEANLQPLLDNVGRVAAAYGLLAYDLLSAQAQETVYGDLGHFRSIRSRLHPEENDQITLSPELHNLVQRLCRETGVPFSPEQATFSFTTVLDDPKREPPLYQRIREEYEAKEEPQEQSEYKRAISHGQLVTDTRIWLEEERKKHSEEGKDFDSIGYLSKALNKEVWVAMDNGEDYNEEGHARFFGDLQRAWDALAYDYCTDEKTRKHLEITIAQQGTEDASIILRYPLQVALLDAMAEATGIPHERGQSVIPVPLIEKPVYAQKMA